MSIEIDVLNGDASWPLAEPLFNAVWPPEVVAKLPWAGIVFAPMPTCGCWSQARRQGVVCHVGIYRRDGRPGTAARSAPAASAALRPARLPPPRLCQHRAQCGNPDLDGRRRHRFRAAVLRTAQCAILSSAAAGSRSTAKSMPSSPSGTDPLRGDRALCLRSQAARAAARASSTYAACPGDPAPVARLIKRTIIALIAAH